MSSPSNKPGGVSSQDSSRRNNEGGAMPVAQTSTEAPRAPEQGPHRRIVFATSNSWRRFEYEFGGGFCTPTNQRDGHPDLTIREQDGERMAACWNACAGMSDPAAEIAKLRAAVSFAAAIFDSYADLHESKGTPAGDIKAKSNREHAAKMRAALGGVP